MTRQEIEELIVERLSTKFSGEPIDVTRIPKEQYELTNANGAIIVRTSNARYRKQGNRIFTRTLVLEVQIWYAGLLDDDTLYKYVDLVSKTVTNTAPPGGIPFEPVSEDPLGYEDETFVFGMLFQTELPYILGQ
jgi:hypothetical protein